jgi:hypothetical protein
MIRKSIGSNGNTQNTRSSGKNVAMAELAQHNTPKKRNTKLLTQ